MIPYTLEGSAGVPSTNKARVLHNFQNTHIFTHAHTARLLNATKLASLPKILELEGTDLKNNNTKTTTRARLHTIHILPLTTGKASVRSDHHLSREKWMEAR